MVTGGNRLSGEVAVGGAKNSVLKLMAATLLAEGTSTITNCPDILDVPLMAEVLRGLGATVELAGATVRITQSYIDRLEAWCDEFNDSLVPLKSFVLPGGSALSALLHVARTVSRRAERSAWDAIEEHPSEVSPLPAKYLNRLSDLLFILCRVVNPDGDVLWQPGGGRSDQPKK